MSTAIFLPCNGYVPALEPNDPGVGVVHIRRSCQCAIRALLFKRPEKERVVRVTLAVDRDVARKRAGDGPGNVG